MRRIHLTTAAICLAAGLGVSMLPALADPGLGRTASLIPAPASTKAPAGYVQVSSAPFNVTGGGHQYRGSVDCPAGKVPLGGGAVVVTGDLHNNINSSFPSGHSWIVDYNIGGLDNTYFTVHAVCANKPKGYQIVHSSALSNPAGQTPGSVNCPGAKVPWSGGVVSSTSNVLVNVNSTYPSGAKTWTVDMNNNSQVAPTFTVYAVCAARPHLYGQSYGFSYNNPESEDTVLSPCGQGQFVVGGGAYSSSASVYVNINSTEVYGTGWRSWMNNDTSATPSFKSYAVCVGI